MKCTDGSDCYFTEKMEEIRTPKCPLHVHIHLPIHSTVYRLLLLGIKYPCCYLRLTLQLIHQITIPPVYQIFCLLDHSQVNINISYKKPFFDLVTRFIHHCFSIQQNLWEPLMHYICNSAIFCLI